MFRLDRMLHRRRAGRKQHIHKYRVGGTTDEMFSVVEWQQHEWNTCSSTVVMH